MIKRLIDVLISLLAIIILFPIMLVIGALNFLLLGLPVIFSQKRAGLNGEVFKLIKFRTMTSATDRNGQLLADSERLTRYGKFLRITSLDELPGLWSVLKGDMSLVGPRPLLVEYLPLYSKEQARRHDVKPGVTGWAQVNGRNAISWEEKFELDVWYVENQSILLDIKILLLTIKKVFVREGISAANSATMPAFKGSSLEENDE